MIRNKLLLNLFRTIKDTINALRKARFKTKIGFLVPEPGPYEKVMVSTRLRVYDIINYLNRTATFYAELYKPWRKYDICIFQKCFNAYAYNKLIKLKKQGTTTLLDINVNYFESSNSGQVTEKQKTDIIRLGKEVDGFITTTDFLKKVVKSYFPHKETICIPENIDRKFFSVKKIHRPKSPLRLLYVGYSLKAKDVLIRKEVLEKLGRDYNLEMVFICDKDPKIKFKNLRTTYIKYNAYTVFKQMLYGDIKISPRNLEDQYNIGHSFTKIGYPMAVGIPVVASPVASYVGSPAILCTTSEEWERNLRRLITDPDWRNELAEKGIKYCKKTYSLDIIGKQYERYFNLINAGV